MMRSLLLMMVVLSFCSGPALAAEGMISVKSRYTVAQTADRLENALKVRGMTLFSRIDHAAGAKATGRELRPTLLMIFGNPEVGTPLIQCQQSIGIDMPQKALIWQDADGEVWFSYNNPNYLLSRHQGKGCEEVAGRIKGALANFASIVTGP